MIAYFQNTPDKKIRAIVIIDVVGQPLQGKRYDHVDNTIRGVTTFLTFAKRQFPGATHCNFYTRDKVFLERIILE